MLFRSTRPGITLAILILALGGAAVAASALKPTRVAARITTGQGPCSENGGLGYLWVSNFRDGTIARVDPATNRVTARIKVGPQPCGVAIGADALWVDGGFLGMLSTGTHPGFNFDAA